MGFFDKSTVNGIRQFFSYKFAWDKFAGWSLLKSPRVKLDRNFVEHILKKIIFFVEDDKNTKIVFSSETLDFIFSSFFYGKLHLNLNAYTLKTITKGLMLLITKRTGTLIQQTQTKTEETSAFIFKKLGESFSFDMPWQLENGEWMWGLTSLENYNSFFNTTKTKNRNNQTY